MDPLSLPLLSLDVAESLLLIGGTLFDGIQPCRQAGVTGEGLMNVTEFLPETGQSIPNDIPSNTEQQKAAPHCQVLPAGTGRWYVFVLVVVHNMVSFPYTCVGLTG
jgi:hypothetical protein